MDRLHGALPTMIRVAITKYLEGVQPYHLIWALVILVFVSINEIAKFVMDIYDELESDKENIESARKQEQNDQILDLNLSPFSTFPPSLGVVDSETPIFNLPRPRTSSLSLRWKAPRSIQRHSKLPVPIKSPQRRNTSV